MGIQFDPETGEFSGQAARLTRFNEDGTTVVVYPTREAYAREVWASLSDDDKADTLWQNDVTEADDEFFAFWTDNIDAAHNGTVTFTRVDGGYTAQDDAAGEGE